MKVLFIFTILFVGSVVPSLGQNDKRFLVRTIEKDGVRHSYRIRLPNRFDPSVKYPVVLYLHGSDERGSDNFQQINSGLARVIDIGSRLSIKEFDRFISVFPQAPKDHFWTGNTADLAVDAVERTVTEFNADPTRVYVTGFSMGGYGSWYLIARYPNKFAAFAPIGGHIIPAFLQAPAKFPSFLRDQIHPDMLLLLEDVDPHNAFAKVVKDKPLWMFHGVLDEQVPIKDARLVAAALKKRAKRFSFTEYVYDGHFVYHKAYTEVGFWRWLLSQRLTKIRKQRHPSKAS